MVKLFAPPLPCSTCPYRRDTPAGVWAAEEYEKLLAYDRQADGHDALATFHCHQERLTGTPTVCRGWLAVHGFASVAVRIAVVRGEVEAKEVTRPIAVPLYRSGAEACAAGLAGVPEPSLEALEKIRRLARRLASRPSQ